MSDSDKALLECAKLIERLANHSMHRYSYESIIVGLTALDKAANLLRSIEWTMGNGQCHACCGQKPRAKWWTDTVGHKKDCSLALALKALGQKVVWEHENHSEARFNMRRWSKRIGKEIANQCASNP